MNIKDALIECGITFPKARIGGRASATVAANSLGDALVELVRTQNQQEFRAKVGLGMGSFADVPWVSLLHSKYDFSASRGFFVVYLFSKDSKVVYLSIGVSAGTANQGKWTAVHKERVRVRAALLRGKCDSLGKQGSLLETISTLDQKAGDRRVMPPQPQHIKNTKSQAYLMQKL